MLTHSPHSRRLRRNVGDTKTGFRTMKVARQQKEIMFLCSLGNMKNNGLRETAAGKFRLVIWQTLPMEGIGNTLPQESPDREFLSELVSAHPAC